jgi:hypothetical protein
MFDDWGPEDLKAFAEFDKIIAEFYQRPDGLVVVFLGGKRILIHNAMLENYSRTVH